MTEATRPQPVVLRYQGYARVQFHGSCLELEIDEIGGSKRCFVGRHLLTPDKLRYEAQVLLAAAKYLESDVSLIDDPLACVHDYHYFQMTNLDGTPAYFRCCLVCEKSEPMKYDEWRIGEEAE